MTHLPHRPVSAASAAGALLVVSAVLFGCAKFKSLFGKGEAADAGADASSVAASDTPSADESGICASAGRKTWGKWANRRTGLTARKIGNKLAVGAALGNRPVVLLFDSEGQGEIVKIDVPPNSELAKEIPHKEGHRHLERVTPVLGPDGRVSAYADYRDTYEDNKRRRVACELVANKSLIMAFDDKPLLEREDDKKETPDAGTVAQKPDGGVDMAKVAQAARKLKLPGVTPGPGAKPAPAEAPASDAGAQKPPDPQKPEPAKKDPTKKSLRELRNCRTFVDPDGAVWGLGSELHGEPQTDDSIKWTMRLFITPNAGGGYFLLDSSKLPKQPKDPKDLFSFEAPSAQKLGDGSVALAARYRGTLMLWLLNADHKPAGKTKAFRGGWPTMAEIYPDDGGLLLLTSIKGDGGQYELRFARGTSSSPPSGLEKPSIEAAQPSMSEPSIATIAGQRWLAYHSGAERDGQLTIVPVDQQLKSVGRASDVVGRAGQTAESRLFALDGGKLLVVYIQAAKDGDELASQVLGCSVKK